MRRCVNHLLFVYRLGNKVVGHEPKNVIAEEARGHSLHGGAHLKYHRRAPPKQPNKGVCAQYTMYLVFCCCYRLGHHVVHCGAETHARGEPPEGKPEYICAIRGQGVS